MVGIPMKAIAAVLAVTLVGCQTQGYQQYADAMARIAEANASVAREQAQAIIMLAHDPKAGETTRSIAVLMLALGAQSGKQQVNVMPPQNEALEWARVLVPSLSTLAMGYFGYRLGVHQSDNAADVSIAGYGAMNGIANSGFAAVGAFKPTPIDWSTFPVTTRIETNVTNRDGQVVLGGDGSQDNSNRPIAVVPPVVPVPVVVTNP